MLSLKHAPLSVACALIVAGVLLAMPSLCFAEGSSDSSDEAGGSAVEQPADPGEGDSGNGSENSGGNNVSTSDEDITPASGGSNGSATETDTPAAGPSSTDPSSESGNSGNRADTPEKGGKSTSAKTGASKASKKAKASRSAKSAKAPRSARSTRTVSLPADPNPSITSNAGVAAPDAAVIASDRPVARTKVSGKSAAVKKVVKRSKRTLFAPWDGSADTSWYFGNESAPSYVISTAEQLAGLSELVNSGYGFSGKSFELSSNIDLSGHEWSPIGAKSYFMGSFDGNGKIVKGATINAGGNYAGLFGATYRATLKNIRLVDVSIAGERYVGGVVGLSYGDSSIEGCKVSGSVKGDYFAGGVVGLAYRTAGEAASTACSYDGTVRAAGYSDEVVGFVQTV